MNRHRITATATIDAPAPALYGIIADYRDGHPHILPPAFRNMTVLQGGVGAGTEIQLDMAAFGKTRTIRGVVTEPTPGRVLVESYPADDTVTTFAVEPVAGTALGARTRVSITTELPVRGGPLGALERLAVTLFLRRLYAAEFRLLAAHAGAPPIR
jgi:hypothetical protein